MAEYLVNRLRSRMKKREPIASITAYDYFSARLAAEADLDFVLVGDSLGNVIHGADSTIAVELSDVVYHTRIVVRHFPAERVVLDMPLGGYLASCTELVKAAVEAFKQSGAGAVKFEGAGRVQLEAAEQLSSLGVPVMGHIGLQPQRVFSQGGFKRQGLREEDAARLRSEARALESAGACSIVLELVQPDLAGEISDELSIPTIGIGSGELCDGQILVIHDVLGLLPGDAPGFARQYAQLYGAALQAVRRYAADVRGSADPPPGQGSQPGAAPGAADLHTAALLADLAAQEAPGDA